MKKVINPALLLTLISTLASPASWAANGKDTGKATKAELAAEISARQAADSGLQSQINTIELTPGPQGPIGATGAPGLDGGIGPQGSAGIDGSSCSAIQGSGSATISCDDGSMASVYDGESGALGNNVGDIQYWDGSAWVILGAPTNNANTLSFCDGQLQWTQGTCINIGDIGPAGGIVFYLNADGSGGLEAAPQDIGVYDWGTSCTSTINTYTAIGTGAQNTQRMIDAGCSGAAEAAADYSLNGYNDWFLPSQDELSALYSHKSVVGGFPGSGTSIPFYWSSSQAYVNKAWYQWFYQGDRRFEYKSLELSVRAIRAF